MDASAIIQERRNNIQHDLERFRQYLTATLEDLKALQAECPHPEWVSGYPPGDKDMGIWIEMQDGGYCMDCHLWEWDKP